MIINRDGNGYQLKKLGSRPKPLKRGNVIKAPKL